MVNNSPNEQNVQEFTLKEDNELRFEVCHISICCFLVSFSLLFPLKTTNFFSFSKSWIKISAEVESDRKRDGERKGNRKFIRFIFI